MVDYLKGLFDCRYGPYRGWVDYEGDRLFYVTFRWGYLSLESTEISLAKLRKRFLQELLILRADLLTRYPKMERPVLFWRFGEGSEIGEDWFNPGTSEKVDYKIRTRLAIPFANYSLVEITPEGEPPPRIYE